MKMTLIDSCRQRGSSVAFTLNDKTKLRNPRAGSFTRKLCTPDGTRRAGNMSACGFRSTQKRKKPTPRARRWAAFKLVVAASSLMLSMPSRSSWAQNAYIQHNLVSDLPGVADHTDTNLLNPWGISFSPTSPFWISDNHSGLSTLYNGSGTPQALVVTIPPPAGGTPPASPTGTVWNNTTGFIATGTTPSRFLFSTEDGTISAWASGPNAVLKVDNSTNGAVYKGLAIGSNGVGTFIYATDFHNGKIDAFDTNFSPALVGAFVDTNIPATFAPFNIQNLNGELYVTYAQQDADKHDDVPGPGHGYVDVFDTSGNLLRRLVAQGVLNSPWGVALAPMGFGPFGGTLLVGNFGGGQINAFDPTTGVWMGTLNGTNGSPLAIPGLWALAFGNGAGGASPQTLYFTAGPNDETDGLFGSLAPLYPAITAGAHFLQHNLVSDLAGYADHTDTNLVNPWGISFSSTSPFWLSDNHSGLSTLYNSSGTPQALVVTIPPPAGGTPPGSPTGTVWNDTTGFFATGTTPSRFLFSTEDGTISAWASGASAVLKVDNSTNGAVYKGLALGSNSVASFIYATDFNNGRVDAFDSNYSPALIGTFVDPTIPAGFAPFNVQNINGQLYVAYAKQDADQHDDVAGPGNGYVSVFDTSGNWLKRFASQGVLNSPWGLAQAPAGFGPFGGALLIGNFGDGRINAFNPTTGVWLGTVNDTNGNPFAVQGLWAIAFGNGGSGGDAHTLYFTAGLNGEADGLFGSLAPVYPTIMSIANEVSGTALSWVGGTGPFQLQMKTNLMDTNWVSVLTTTNHSVTNAFTEPSSFFRLLNQGD
jgi:uncharacterized protein (TIGR03118 family)